MKILLEEEKKNLSTLEGSLKEQIETTRKFSAETEYSSKEIVLQGAIEKFRYHLKEKKQIDWIIETAFTCGIIDKALNEFVHPVTQKAYPLRDYINCQSKNVVYALVCPCPLIYVGQTTQELRKRIQQHLSNISLVNTHLKQEWNERTEYIHRGRCYIVIGVKEHKMSSKQVAAFMLSEQDESYMPKQSGHTSPGAVKEKKHSSYNLPVVTSSMVRRVCETWLLPRYSDLEKCPLLIAHSNEMAEAVYQVKRIEDICQACELVVRSGEHERSTNRSSRESENAQYNKDARKILDYILDDNESEDTQQQTDTDEQVSEEENYVDYQPEDTDSSDQSDEEVTGAEAAPAERFKFKSGKISWSSVPPDVHGRADAANVIKMTPGITRFAVTRVSDIKTCFDLFMPLSIKKVIIAMIEGKKVHGNMWNDLHDDDLDAYIGVLLLAGVYRSCNEATDSLWDASTGRNIFRATMSLQKFQMISRVLRFDNRDTRTKSKLAPIRDVWEKWVQLLPLMFNPGPEVTVDECFFPFRGNCPFRQYMPIKPGKYGIKIWVACDAKTSYAWNLQIYTGKSASGIPEKKQGKRVVLDMTTGLHGHIITYDNFFTSYDLGLELLRRKITMVGTVKKTKPELPAEWLQMKDRAPLSSKFVFTDTTTAVSYYPKKRRNVVLMSTLHKDAAASSGSEKKPRIILDYNKNIGGVDNLDKLTVTYTCQRMTRRWPMVIFSNILDVSAYNAFVLWTHIPQGWNSKKNKRRKFLEELERSLVKAHIDQREQVPRDPAAEALVRQLQSPSASPTPTATQRASSPASSSTSPASTSTTTATTPVRPPDSKRIRCQVCPSNKDRKTNTSCFACKKYLCKEHTNSVAFCHTCI
ncbi:LOW QUALITY PROTEIN: uncharacterized protein ACNLHF_016667 [Anomaloglossus baeobatrachus]